MSFNGNPVFFEGRRRNQSSRTLSSLIARVKNNPVRVQSNGEPNEAPVRKKVKYSEQTETGASTEICPDPLEHLPDLCANEIMSYLTGKDLIHSMLVSRRWSDFIKVRCSLMDKIVVKPSFEKCSQIMMHKILNGEDRRNYKHMITPYIFKKKSFAAIYPITPYASTLETLTVKPNYLEGHWIDPNLLLPQDFVFPKLRKLTFTPGSQYSFFNGSSFPVLKYLHIDQTCFYGQYDPNISSFLAKCPLLEIFWDCRSIHQNHVFEYKPKSEEFLKTLPKIKLYRSNSFNHAYMRDYQASLKKIEINVLDKRDMSEILEHFKTLKQLTVNTLNLFKFDQITIELKRNDSIEVLHISSMIFPNGDPTHEIQNLLLALPSLKELHLSHTLLNKDILKLIARNLRRLEKLSCNKISHVLRQAHEEIQLDSHFYVNSSFMLRRETFPNILTSELTLKDL